MLPKPRLRVFPFLGFRSFGFRSLGLAAGILLAGLTCVLPAATVSGMVTARDGSRLKPVFRAEVIAREGGSAEIAAVARTDREGRFLITGLTTPKVTLAVQKSRYFTASANGREGENLSLDCSVPADCSDVRFELALGAVISGMVRDEFGEAVEMALVSAATPEESRSEMGGPPMGRNTRTITDERGYFRFFGVKPGPYILKAERPARGPMASRAFEGEPVDIEAGQGREIHGILITGRRSESAKSFSVSGRVSGVNSTASDDAFVSVQSLNLGSMRRGSSTGSSVEQDGSFTFPRLTAGRYAFSYVRRANRGMWAPQDLLPLGVIDVQSDLTGLVLKPAPPTGFSGALRFESGKAPPEVAVFAISSESWRPAGAAAKAPDYRFEITNLTPGTYRLEIELGSRGFVRGREAGEFFVRGIRRGGEITPAREVAISEGKIETVELVISNEFSRVYGRVKAAGEPGTAGSVRKGAQFQVGLSGPSGFRVMQADQNGRFDFDRVVAGEYRICAWSNPDTQPIYDDKTWAAAGDAVRKFSVEVGSEVEIDLTAVP
jgi:hypothetical protein